MAGSKSTRRGKDNSDGESTNKNADSMDIDEEDRSKKANEGGNNENPSGNADYDEYADDAEDEEDDYEFKWLDKGKRRNGRVEYDTVLLTLHETSFRVSKNDFVLLWGIHGDDNEKEADGNQTIEEIWQSAGCAKVEAMWEEPSRNGRKKAMFQARWFFQVTSFPVAAFSSTDDAIGSTSPSSHLLQRKMI